jgi:hypothetical protein
LSKLEKIMSEIIVVGGGIAGLLAAEALKDAGLSVVGLEGSSTLGGRIEVGHHRVHSELARESLKSLLDGLELSEVQEPPLTRTKGEWQKAEEAGEFSEAEKFYLSEHYWIPTEGYSKLIARLVDKVGPSFQTRKLVTEVHASEKRILCEDGVEHPYSHLVWCSPLRALRTAWAGDKSPLKGLSKIPDRQGGISLEVELKEPLFSSKNTVILPFRFKEWRLRALGFPSTSGAPRVQWVLFLEDEILEDREEVAKCVRTLKREIGKEFPNAASMSVREKLTYLPVISGEAPLEWKSTLITPDIAYFGPETRLEGMDESWRNMDLTLANYPALKRDLESWKNTVP